MNGEQLVFTELLQNDFTTSLLLADGRIQAPAGVSQYWAFGSIMFQASAAGATGRRWARLIRSNAGNTVFNHAGNFPTLANGTDMPTVCPVNTGGWAAITPGECIGLYGIQDSGASLTLSSGSLSNLGASTFLRVHFR